ncbi:hypothetical protein BZG82_05700 [Salinivibrio sp. PR5]|uniref:hypothetical protein n=1 Tax=Salinivibrio sp. PR5 TaxID=1909484 RepID=UPI000989C330|nr:hypothetical protein [Salinivibrio sp. PR5]OOF11108.1 hypothetical protein BZG82_05700 [Salinivibrio sp. PR5]
MIISGQILSETDLQIKTRTNPHTGEVTKTGSMRLLTFEPTEIIDVRISTDQMNAGAIDALKKFIGKQLDFKIAYRNFSFADDNGKHVAMSGFNLVELPKQA